MLSLAQWVIKLSVVDVNIGVVMIIVETGAIVPNANSYISVADLRAYAALRELNGPLLPDDDALVETIIILAMDYLEQYSFKGREVDFFNQCLKFPRQGVYVGSNQLPSNTIPTILKNALCVLCIDTYEVSGQLQTNQDGYGIKQETIGPLTTVYAISSTNTLNTQPIFSKFEGTIGPLLTNNSGLNMSTSR